MKRLPKSLGQREYERGVRFRDGHSHVLTGAIVHRTLNGVDGFPYRQCSYCECWIPVEANA